MKRRDKIISNLETLNKEISGGQRENPAVVKGNDLTVDMRYYTSEQKDKLVKVVSKWGFKIEQEIMNELLEKKIELEAELAQTFKEE